MAIAPDGPVSVQQGNFAAAMQRSPTRIRFCLKPKSEDKNVVACPIIFDSGQDAYRGQWVGGEQDGDEVLIGDYAQGPVFHC